MVGAVLLLTSALLLDTWTVDDDGPADFATVGDAVAAAAPGDVVLVQPGTYPAFTLTKALTVLGPVSADRPDIAGNVRVIGAPSFTLTGLDLQRLAVHGVHGRGLVDDCTVGVWVDALEPEAVLVTDSQQLVLSRLEARGLNEAPNFGGGDGVALRVAASRIVVVDSQLQGGQGRDVVDGGAGNGSSGLTISGGSVATVVGTTVVGGRGGYADGPPFSPDDGDAADGIDVTGSTLILRGSNADHIVAGVQANFGEPGHAISASNSTVAYSGVTPSRWELDDATIVLGINPAEPYLEVTSTVDAGTETFSVDLFGPPGELALLAASLLPGLATVDGFEEQLWLDPANLFVIVPLTTLGQQTPLALTWEAPLGLGFEGVTVHLQAFFPGIAATLDRTLALAGNPAALVVRF